MIIKALRVSNFRSILGETLLCDNLTALVGPNGSGKSSFLRALDLFFAPTPNCIRDDFYAHDTDQDIEIEVTFTSLTDEEKSRFGVYMEGNDLTVARVFTESGGKGSGKYYGSRLQNSDFAEVRRCTGRDLLNRYRELRETGGCPELPAARSQADALGAMETWEGEHPDRLQRIRDDGQFFGFTNVARGYLGDITRFIFIPAVRDAADEAEEGKNAAITILMDLVVRATLSRREDFAKFREEVETSYKELTDPTNISELGTLAVGLTGTLRTYYPDASVALNWLPTGGIELPLPKADVRLVEDEFEIPVTRTGHGLQRAFILTMLQHLAVARATQATATGSGEAADEELTQDETPKLNLILGIEEPELYQHPSRQRHFARILYELARGEIPGVAGRTQILYSTHSPLLVGIDRFDQVRRVSRTPTEDGRPKTTAVVSTTWDAVAETIWRADGEPSPKFTAATIKPRVSTLMTPWMNEGFFADVVVLVEGEDDRAAILGAAQAKGIHLESDGFAVIPCGGKASLDRPAAIFQGLGIPIYLLWDADKGKFQSRKEENSKKGNHRLLRLVEATVTDWPATIQNRYACFEVNLETTMKAEIGADTFDRLLQQQQEAFAIPEKDQAIKKPLVIAKVLEAANQEGKACSSLEQVVDKIVALKGLPGPSSGA